MADLGGLAVGQLGVLEVVEVLDHDLAVLGDGLDVQGALAVLLDDDVQTAGNGGLIFLALETLLTLGLSRVLALDLLVGEGAVLVENVIGLVVGKVRNGEADGDAGAGWETWLAINEYGCGGEVNGLLLVAELALEDDVLLAGDIDQLEGAVVQEVLDAGGQLLVLLHLALKLQLAVKLERQLLIDLASGLSAELSCGEVGGEL